MHLTDDVRWTAVLRLTTLPIMLMTVPAVAQVNAPTSYQYSYFKDHVPLALADGRIAFFVADSGVAAPTPHPPSLSRMGIGAEDVQRSELAGWSVATTAAGLRGAPDIEGLVAALADSADFDFVSPVFQDANGDPLLITSDLLIGFEDSVVPAQAEEFLTARIEGVLKDRDWAGMPGVYRVATGLLNGFDVLSLANELAQRPEVKFAEPDMILTARRTWIPGDPYFNYLWGLHNTGQSGGTPDQDMDGPEAWDTSTGDPSIIVVILDDGVQQDHPDISQDAGWDFTGHGTGGGPYNECDNHGTAVAGCTSAVIDNGIGVVGIAPDCTVRSAKFNTANVPCDGGGTFYISYFVNALNWAQSIGARVTSNSNSFSSSSSITSKYDSTYAAGLIHFAATGNEGTGSIAYPSSLDSVNAVGAVNRNGNRWSSSNYGTGIAFTAPGVSIATTDRTGSDGYSGGSYVTGIDGTSFASPYAAGVAALILSVDPSLAATEVEQIMQETAVDRGATGYDVYYGWGFVNAYAALQELPCFDNDCDDGVYCNGTETCVPDPGEPEGYRCDAGENPCPPPCWVCDEVGDWCIAAGACCFGDGTCEQLGLDECTGAGGLYYGDCSDCNTLDPPCEPSDTWITCELSTTQAAADTTVFLELKIQEVENLAGYQAQVVITRIGGGAGELSIDCSGCPDDPCGVRIDADDPDYVFYGLSEVHAINCPAKRILSALVSDVAAVGTTPAYLGGYTLDISADAEPGTEFEVALVTDPSLTYLRNREGWPIPFQVGAACTLTVLDPSACLQPAAEPGGSKYLLVTPVGELSQALLVAGDAGDPTVSCVWAYVQQDSTLGADPVFQTPAEWGTVPVHGTEIIPGATYHVQADCGPELSPSGVATTWPWGDVAHPPDGVVNVQDALAIIAAFQEDFTNVTLERADLDPCEPNRVINVQDILAALAAFQGEGYMDRCPVPCR